jgi:hypothetical protein
MRGNPDSELIEVSALRGVGAGWISGQGGAERDRVLQAGVGVASEVGVAVCSAARLQAGRHVRKIGALPGRDTVWIAPAALASMGWTDMVIGTAVLIVGNENYRILPVGAIPNGIDHLRDVSLAAQDVGRRMFVIFKSPAAESKVGIDEGKLRKRPRRGLGKKEIQRQEARNCRVEAAGLGRILEVVGPSHVVFIHVACLLRDRPGVLQQGEEERSGLLGHRYMP